MDKMPEIRLKKDRQEPLLRFHPWVFSGSVADSCSGLTPGIVTRICDSSGKPLALGFYNDAAIRFKLFCFDPLLFDDPARAMAVNFDRAFTLRQNLELTSNLETSCYRLINGEGDQLPGLIIDIYNKVAVVQFHSPGMLAAAQIITANLQRLYDNSLTCIYSRSGRTLEGAVEGPLSGALNGPEIVLENGLKFEVDIATGQKTGFFLDQRDNRQLLGRLARGRTVLNAFSYTGGFSVYALAGGAREVHSLDISKTAVSLAVRNADLNFSHPPHKTFAADFFDFLGAAPAEYDLIILDPPSFAKHRAAVKQALRGYQTINHKALRAVKNGELVATFSCTQLVSPEQFESAVMAAAIEARRPVKCIHRLNQAPCHPVNMFHPEGRYLKGLVLEVN